MIRHRFVDTTFEIHAILIGELWWPIGAPPSRDVSFSFARAGRPWVNEADTIRGAVEQLMRLKDGDFSTAPRIEGVLTIVRRTARRETRRSFDLRRFVSMDDYLAPEEDGLNARPGCEADES